MNSVLDIFIAIVSLKTPFSFKLDFGDNTSTTYNRTGLIYDKSKISYQNPGLYLISFSTLNDSSDKYFNYTITHEGKPFNLFLMLLKKFGL